MASIARCATVPFLPPGTFAGVNFRLCSSLVFPWGKTPGFCLPLPALHILLCFSVLLTHLTGKTICAGIYTSPALTPPSFSPLLPSSESVWRRDSFAAHAGWAVLRFLFSPPIGTFPTSPHRRVSLFSRCCRWRSVSLFLLGSSNG